MWKPGQIVTVQGIRYRVVRDEFPTCHKCAFFYSGKCYEFPCNECLNVGGKFKLPDDCHLEKICLKKAKP